MLGHWHSRYLKLTFKLLNFDLFEVGSQLVQIFLHKTLQNEQETNRLNLAGCGLPGNRLWPGKYTRLLQKYWKTAKKCDWLVFNSQLLNFDWIDSNAIFNSVFASIFHIVIFRSIAHLRDKTGRKKLLKTRWSFKLECWPSVLNHSCQVHAKQKWATKCV